MPNLVSPDQFKQHVKNNDSFVSDVVVTKTIFGVEKQINREQRTIDFIISTEAMDRDNDMIKVDGWDLDNYLKNPVVLWAHDSRQLPVAKSIRTVLENGKLKSTAQFCDREQYAFADTVFQLYLGGFLNAVSVGFRAKEYSFCEEDDRPYGMNFLKQELMEYSCVPVPSNPEALVEARSKGIDLSPLNTWAEELLDLKNYLLVPKSLLEQIQQCSSNKTAGIISMTVKQANETVEQKVDEKEAEATSQETAPVQENNDEQVKALTEELKVLKEKVAQLEEAKSAKDDDSVEFDFDIATLKDTIQQLVVEAIHQKQGKC